MAMMPQIRPCAHAPGRAPGRFASLASSSKMIPPVNYTFFIDPLDTGKRRRAGKLPFSAVFLDVLNLSVTAAAVPPPLPRGGFGIPDKAFPLRQRLPSVGELSAEGRLRGYSLISPRWPRSPRERSGPDRRRRPCCTSWSRRCTRWAWSEISASPFRILTAISPVV